MVQFLQYKNAEHKKIKFAPPRPDRLVQMLDFTLLIRALNFK